MIWTLVEDAAIVENFLLHPELQHSVVLTLIAHSERCLASVTNKLYTMLRTWTWTPSICVRAAPFLAKLVVTRGDKDKRFGINGPA